ncbi:solute carrier family 44 protein member 2, putative, partial [Ichthyophthirius multifiliis]
ITCGPISQRSFKDITFIFIYILFWIGTIFIASFAIENGNINKIFSPFDPDGRQCGFGEAQDYPYMHFNNILKSSLGFDKYYACVKECIVDQSKQKVYCLRNKYIQDCNQIENYISNKFLSLCIPIQSEEIQYLRDILNIGNPEQYISDLKTAIPLFIGIFILSFCVSLIFLFLLRICAGFITWIIFSGYFIGLISLGFICIFNNQEYEEQRQKLQLIGLFLFLITIFSFIIFICYFSKIRSSIAIMKASSDFTRKTFSIFFIPILLSIFVFLYFAFWTYIVLHIFSSGKIKNNEISPLPQLELNSITKFQIFYYIFGLFWNIELSIAVCQLTIASAACMWYFSHRPYCQTQNSVLKSFTRAMTFHFGSVLFGSLIISIVQLIKFLVNQIYNDIKKVVVSDNNTQNYFIKCCRCCLFSFEKYIRFINNNAFIIVALTGESFINSAKQSFSIVYRNQSQMQISQGIGSIFSTFGKYFISILCTGSGYIIIMNVKYFNDKIFSHLFVCFVFFVISYTVGSIFMNIYGMASDSLLICLLSDKELNKGKLRACPDTLQEFENKYM